MSDFPYDFAVTANEVEMDRKRVERIAHLFLQQQHEGLFPGGQLVVRRHGKKVLNLSCGIARGWHGRGGETEKFVTETTPFAVFSSGKPMAAIVIAMLESRGLLDINEPVAKLLPEFGSLGREEITLLEVLTHKAGILLPDLIHNPQINASAEAAWKYLLQTPPHFPRGTFAYMPTEYGIIIEQVVRQVTGKTVAEFFQTELAKPLSLNNMHYGLGNHQLDDLAWNHWLGKDRYVVAEMDVAKQFEQKNNDISVFSANNSAFSMVSDAANLAAFYEMLVNGGKNQNGQQLISSQIIQQYTHKQVSGWNRSMNTYLALGRGFMLGTTTPSFYDWWGSSSCFGHPGIFSSLAYGDHKTGLAVAIVTNGNKSITDFFKRFVRLNHNLRKACR